MNFSFLNCLPHRGNGTQVRNHLRNLLEHIIHILLGVGSAEGQAQRAMGHLMRKSQGQKHMAGVQRTGGAGRAGGGFDPLGIQEQQERFTLDALEADIYVAGEPVLRVAIDYSEGEFG